MAWICDYCGGRADSWSGMRIVCTDPTCQANTGDRAWQLPTRPRNFPRTKPHLYQAGGTQRTVL